MVLWSGVLFLVWITMKGNFATYANFAFVGATTPATNTPQQNAGLTPGAFSVTPGGMGGSK